MSCEQCSRETSGYCGFGGACNGPDKDDYLKRCRKRPSASDTKTQKQNNKHVFTKQVKHAKVAFFHEIRLHKPDFDETWYDHN